MILNITCAALDHIASSLEKRGKGQGIKVGVKEVGCSGFKYTLEYVDEPLPPSHVDMAFHDFTVYIAPEHQKYFEHATLDYVKTGLNEGFEFTNPQEKSRCGCGESFKV